MNKSTQLEERFGSLPKISMTLEEELLLTVPDNLAGLTKDKFLMVRLTKDNSDIVEKCIASDPAYQSKGKTIMEQFFNADDYSENAYSDIINRIAIENSTRTSKEAIMCLAAYCANPDNKFLELLREGELTLVDKLLEHLVKSGHRKDKSLVSKVCRYLNEWLYGGCAYTINDTVVRTILPYYLAYYKIDPQKWQGKNFAKLSYVDFYEIFSLVRCKTNLNNHQLDHLIWYEYKNDGIRREVAKALAAKLI